MRLGETVAPGTVEVVGHPSDSPEQRAVESLILAGLAPEYGPLAPMTLRLPGGARVDVDGVAPDRSVFVEAFAHQGRMKGSQPKKVAQDALKLITIRREQPEARVVLAFADEVAARSVLGKGWLAEALQTWAVEVRVVQLDDETRERIVAAQLRQQMINPPSPPRMAGDRELPPSQPTEDAATLALMLDIEVASLLDLLPGEPWLPQPVDLAELQGEQPDDVVWLAAGNPILVLVGAAPGEAVVAVPKIAWHGPHTLVLGVVSVKRHKIGDDLAVWLATEISAARTLREATFTICVRCQQRLGPESMHVDGLCQSCATQDGVVF